MTTQCYYIVKVYNNGRYYFLSYYTKWEKQARPTMNMAVLFHTHAAASRAANTLTDVDSVEVEEICVEEWEILLPAQSLDDQKHLVVPGMVWEERYSAAHAGYGRDHNPAAYTDEVGRALNILRSVNAQGLLTVLKKYGIESTQTDNV